MTEAPRARPRWARWVTFGSLGLAMVALGWTLYSVGFTALVYRLLRIGPWFALVVVLEVLVTLCDGAAIHGFLRPDHKKAGYGRTVLAQVAGRAVNAVTPMGSLGEVVKMTTLMERVPQPRALSAVLLYNITNTELSFVLIAMGATLSGVLLELPSVLRTLLIVTGAVTAVLAVVMPVLVMRGMLSTFVGMGRAVRVISVKQAKRWRRKLEDIDEKLRDTGGARRRDRMIALGFVLLSRSGSWLNTAILIHAAGAELSVGFLAAVLTAGQVIQWISAVVPLGLGITESGNYALFRALGVEPSIGVTVALGKRVTQLIYAAIGLVLVSVNQTVKEAKAAHKGGRAQGR
jgi:uncharacterized protein (TIRG00374 family)